MEGKVLGSWKASRMLPKKGKPKVLELRPTAVTNIFMSAAVKGLTEEHIATNNQVKENQSGSTKKRRLENNLVILQYCLDKSYRERNFVRYSSGLCKGL